MIQEIDQKINLFETDITIKAKIFLLVCVARGKIQKPQNCYILMYCKANFKRAVRRIKAYV